MKKFVPIFILVVLLLGAGGYYYATSMSPSSDIDSMENSDEMMAEKSNKNKMIDATSGKFTGSFMDLMMLGENYTCEFSSVDEDGLQSSGTIYVEASSERLNGTFTVPSESETYVSNVIRDDSYIYAWVSNNPQGFKMEIPENEDELFGDIESYSETADDTSTDISELYNTDDVDFDCSSWDVDEAMFVPPSNIEFVDMQEMMKQFQDSMQDQGLDCSVCDSAPEGSARNQCLQALGC